MFAMALALLASNEHMRIQEGGDRLVFTAKPAGKPEDSFGSLARLDTESCSKISSTDSLNASSIAVRAMDRSPRASTCRIE